MRSYVDRFRAKATKARQAQSRLKALERMELIAPAHVDSPFNFSFPEPERASDPLLRLDEADLGYGAEPVLRNVDMQLRPGSRVGLLGRNGAGKSTLLKTLTGELPLMAGQRTLGAHGPDLQHCEDARHAARCHDDADFGSQDHRRRRRVPAEPTAANQAHECHGNPRGKTGGPGAVWSGCRHVYGRSRLHQVVGLPVAHDQTQSRPSA